MRFVIGVDDDWQVNITCADVPEKSWRRAMRKCPDGRAAHFPIPPENEMPAASELHYKLCSGDAQAFLSDYDAIALRDLPTDVNRRFGRYLFEALIGTQIWNEILETAASEKQEFIELNLSWGHTATDLHRLNWEMMHGPDGFLFLERRIGVAVSRGVPHTANFSPRRADIPPRLLFIIGTSLYDQQIRAGAEYLGLLRQLKREEKTINSRVLQRASPQKITEVVKRFEPDVVHFICHGGIEDGHGYLELELDEKESSKQRYAPQLVEYLNAATNPPSIVVLSACQTASVNSSRMLGARDLAPLAAELVAAGIPIVIGMGGQISDLACRLFTRRFGEALLLGHPLVMATTEGRRAAFSEGDGPYTSADWAFPAVFLAEGVEPNYVPVQAAEHDHNATVGRWIRDYRIGDKPVFCSRDEFFEEYYDLIQRDGKSVLVAYVDRKDPGYGRSRLLQHLAATALREGHVPVPCFIGTDAPDWAPPENIAQLCVNILSAIGVARSALGLSPPVESKLLKMLKSKRTSDDIQQLELDMAADPETFFGPLLECFVGMEDVLKVNAIKNALQADLTSLIRDAREKHPLLIREDARPILLMDEVHKYDKAVIPLFYELFPLVYHAGEELTRSVPVILTWSFGTPADEWMRPIKEKASSRPWLRFKQLKEFDEGEDMLVYEQVLLHPFDPTLDEFISNKSWAFNYNVDPVIVQRFEQKFRHNLKQIPLDFFNEKFFLLAQFAQEAGFLIPADDDVYLEKDRTRDRT